MVEKLDSLSVKRKYQVHNGVTKKWWFVVRGNKAAIDLLESEWSKIEIQTGLKLQPLLSYADTVVNDAVVTPIVSNNDAVTIPTSPTAAVVSIRSSLILPPSSPSTATVSFPNSNFSIATLTPESFESDPSPPAEIPCGQSFLVVGQTPQPPA